MSPSGLKTSGKMEISSERSTQQKLTEKTELEGMVVGIQLRGPFEVVVVAYSIVV